ncbi:CoA transferase [Roseovarius sp. Pro17]|uniref:CoA transferase n=1 Tax=Roseovarius sp. Pro17 TaxID=3108175 RepID=UPI002D780F08|nr:CoA transferase [Roseovarius sp. Pro17]
MTTDILKGIRVLDLSRMLSGPYCTMMLADHGAEVIKIEGAGGDTSRTNGPFRDDDPERLWAGYFVSLNRNKKSVQLNLKSEEGKAAFRALAATADVVVENFRPGVMERLGLSYESLAEANPKLVYAAIRGFGDPRTGESPYSDWPSYDVVAQAMGGVMAITGPNANSPTKVGPGVGDIFTGLMMSFGIMAALREAEATGKGQFTDVAMYDAMISLCERATYLHDMTGAVPGPEGNGHPFLAPFGVFPTTDGAIALGIVDDAFWQVLSQIMDRPELGSDPRYATRAARAIERGEVNRMVGEWTARHDKAALTDLLGGKVPFGPLNTIKDIFADPHVAARGMLTQIDHPSAGAKPWTVAANPLRFASRPERPYAPPPTLGEHDALVQSAAAPQIPQEDKLALRNAFGTFPTGVTVVTTRQADGTPRGFTANSFTSVSLDPPLLLVCIAKTAHSCDVFAEAGHFAINVLSEDQKAVSGLFASRSPDKFNEAGWHSGSENVPLLDDSLCTFACARHKLVDAGDHLVLIGRVLAHETTDKQPLGYHRGGYFSIGLEEELVKAAGEADNVAVGALVVKDGQVVLQAKQDGTYTLPTAPATSGNLDGLIAMLKDLGLSPVLEHLYAVYHDREADQHRIYYHGTVTGDIPATMRCFDFAGIPFDSITSAAERSMLSRYTKEFRHGSFGIYQGDQTTGTVNRIADRTRYEI